MANLDSRFICTSDLELLLRDNASGLPLSGGIVTFYSDVNRTVLKPVYQLSGMPGNYDYTVLNNPCTLSSAGTFQDALGNNIVPYYYPFTGTPRQNTGVQELYYITVVNSGFVPQFTRQGWPQSAGSGVTPSGDSGVDNFIPNGQFLSHNAIVSITEPPITQYTFGSETVDAQAIAQGGWNFVYTNANTAVFNNSFSQIPSSGGWGINSFPKFIFNFVCSSFNANAMTRDLRIQWPDVNKFSSGNPAGSSDYTLFFDAKSNDGNSYVFSLYRIYYFGTGGSPSTPISNLLGTITVGPNPTFVSHNIQNIKFPANQGTIGTNGDDYVALSLRGPASAWNAAFSDFALVPGNEELTSFPVQTNDQMLSRGVAGWMPTPNPDGTDLYLPLILTTQGMIFDHSEVGTIVSAMRPSAINNELPCDGSTYKTASYSTLGIPYSRLQSYFFQSNISAPIFGTGATFATAYINSGATTHLLLYTNATGSQTNTADGTPATGFTFITNLQGTGGINYSAFSNANAIVTAYSNFTTGTHNGNGVAPGTSGMSVASLNNPNLTTMYYAFNVTALSAAALANPGSMGKYFSFSDHSTDFYIWFFLTNETDPAPFAGTGIKLIMDPGMAAADMAVFISNAINSHQQTYIATLLGSAIPAGANFIFNASGTAYTVYYTVDGVGAVPTTANPIKVAILSTDTAVQVTSKTQIAINSEYFAVPDMRGMFIRGSDTTVVWDLNAASRWGYAGLITGGAFGSFEYDSVVQHDHTVGNSATGASNTNAGYAQPSASTVFNTSTVHGQDVGTETRPVNVAVNFFIKY